MNTHIFRSLKEPIRGKLSWHEYWQSADNGLIICWEVGRKLREKELELSQRARRGELPVLAWKGGVVKKTTSKKPKYGTLFYLAQWQGLRAENLDIKCAEQHKLVCTKTDQTVIYTDDANKWNS